MNYKGKLIFLTGASGFLGKALEARLKELGATVQTNDGRDVRDPATFAQLDQSYDYIFHFAAPSSQVLFQRKPSYCIESTIQGFINAAQAAHKNGIRLIYPSTGLLSQGKFNEYAMCKKICEDYVKNSGIDALGIRVFATYGPGEGHKADYASVPYLFVRDMVNGQSPLVFGDGSQTRDFIYVDDVVESIVIAAEQYHKPIIDVGSAVKTSFNEIIEIINSHLTGNKDRIEPRYIKAPAGYVGETLANRTDINLLYENQVSLDEGLKKIVDSFLNIKQDVEIL